MAANEQYAFEKLHDEIERERARAECPCMRALLVILSRGLDRIAQADQQAQGPVRGNVGATA
jgi:hypothetical protein